MSICSQPSVDPGFRARDESEAPRPDHFQLVHPIGVTVQQRTTTYSANKAALNGLDGITAKAIALGFFKSDMALGARDMMLEALGEAAT